nr:limonene cyclase homolog F24O1.12 - Arabidopsis thaliana [Arabidopsis thaliana]
MLNKNPKRKQFDLGPKICDECFIHSIWNERNQRRHGKSPSLPERLIKMIDKNVRNRLSTMSGCGVLKYKDEMRVWFASRA